MGKPCSIDSNLFCQQKFTTVSKAVIAKLAKRSSAGRGQFCSLAPDHCIDFYAISLLVQEVYQHPTMTFYESKGASGNKGGNKNPVL